MKVIVGISLFIFWAIVVAILVAGLVFYSPVGRVSNSIPAGNNPSNLLLDLAEVARHNLASDCWMIIGGKVYNVTGSISAHPGGQGTIIAYCGKEATNAFVTKDIGRPHSGYANDLLTQYYIGELNQNINQTQLEQTIQETNSVNIPDGGENDGGEIEDD